MGTGFYGSNDPTNSVKALKVKFKVAESPQIIVLVAALPR